MGKLLSNFKGLFLPLLASTLLTSCGSEKPAEATRTSTGKIEAAFIKSAQINGIPARFMMAAAWQESRLSPKKASSLYLNTTTGESDSHKGVILAQTAFGISNEKLGLTDPATAEDFETQIIAYGAWLAKSIGEKAILSPNPNNSGDKFSWIELISQAHREGTQYSRNVRVIFVKEMIQILNEGFVWQDPNSEDIITFPKETPTLKIEDLPQDGEDYFKLDTQRPEIDSANYLRLGKVNNESIANVPNHIEVIHCPLTLSACLELQNQATDDDIRLEAHYIIPQDDQIVTEPFQIAKHQNAVRMTNSKGVTNHITDAVVVMLVGNSGRIVDGYRDPAIPVWSTKWQLRRMGDVINDVCLLLTDQKATTLEDCMKVGKGVRFHSQDASEAYRWGDIADFDPMIFSAYISSPGGLQGETVFEFPGSRRQFNAGSPIQIRLLFRPEVQHIELERLVRCPDRKLVWAPVANEEVRSQTIFTFEKKLFDSGPNLNGNQFFRAKVYGGNSNLIGWDVSEIYLKDYEEQSTTVTPKICLLHGS